MSLGLVFLSEVFGTAMLTLLGCGVVANVALKGTKGNNGGFLMVTWGWGIAVFAGVYVAARSGAHLNPAVTTGLLINGKAEYAPGVAVDLASTLTYYGGELTGAFLGAVLTWLAHKQHFDAEPEPANKLGVFSTGPAIRSTPWNLITEIIGTFVLVFVSVCPWADLPATPSTPPVTSVPASPTPSCPSRARAPATGATPGFRLPAPSLAASSPVSWDTCPSFSRQQPEFPHPLRNLSITTSALKH